MTGTFIEFLVHGDKHEEVAKIILGMFKEFYTREQFERRCKDLLDIDISIEVTSDAFANEIYVECEDSKKCKECHGLGTIADIDAYWCPICGGTGDPDNPDKGKAGKLAW